MLEVIDPPRLGIVVNSPSPALPVLVLLTMLFVTVGGIFVLDNWRRSPSVQSVEADVASDDTGDTLRRIAPASAAASSAGPPTSAASASAAAAQGAGVETIAQRRGVTTLASRPRDE